MFVSENNRQECPRIKIQVLDQSILALIDTGCEVSIMNEHLYNQLKHHGLNCLELPTQHVNLLSAFNKRSNRVKRQALLGFKIKTRSINQVMLLSPQLVTDVILGLDFLMDHGAIINFSERSISLKIEDKIIKVQFFSNKEADEVGQAGKLTPGTDDCHIWYGSRSSPRAELQTADLEEPIIAGGADTVNKDEKGGVRMRNEKRQQPWEKVELSIPRQKNREGFGEVTSGYAGRCWSNRGTLKTLTNDRSGHAGDEYAVKVYLKGEFEQAKNSAAANTDACVMNTDLEAATASRRATVKSNNTDRLGRDDRAITTDQLREKVKECNNLSGQQQTELYKLLLKYQPYFTKRPGRCNMFEYEFNVIGDVPTRSTYRPIPFALRDRIRGQIQVMMQDGILEESFSDYLNPLTLVEKEDKAVRICVDARRVNQHMIADHTKVLPLREQLQRFYGTKYITSLDLSNAFLQVPLQTESRKWTAFQFLGKVYQYTSVPFGTKNSQAAFIRALERVFGDYEENGYLVTYVDDLLIHSATFEEHIIHVDEVLRKLTEAGFTINAAKCQFCKPEIKFLGHIISDQTVRPDKDRIEAILAYPAPKTQKQLRRFLGICNFHKQFIINYASYIEPLLTLLRKGNKWKWTGELQQAFEILRSKFAESLWLVHPDENKGWIINTDASGKAIGSVLMQEDGDGGVNVISTTSRILKPAEQRYTTCEKELLAIVDALQRFKIHIHGQKVILNTDNQALTFLNKCVITSNRVARWIAEIQQFDLEIRHIKGVDNYLADILSRHPKGLTDKQTRELARPDQIMVHRIQLYEDKALKTDLQTIATLQDADPKIAAIKGKVGSQPHPDQDRYRILDNVLYCRGGKPQERWRAMLPAKLEQKLLKYIHLSLGHLGVDKCVSEINYVFHVNNLGRKIRKFIAECDVCQRVKHPNRSIEIEERHHLPKLPGDLCAIDIYGNLPTSRGGVRYILVCLDVFSGFIKLYALKANTTRACLNKLVNHYFTEVITPKIILSDNATQFRSPSWQKQLRNHGVETRFTPVRHPQSNPSERCMRELGKFCRIYCHDSHRKWAELLPYIERWTNHTVASSRGYSPHELMFGADRQNVIQQIVPNVQELDVDRESMEAKIENAYEKIKSKAKLRERRHKRGNIIWKPNLNEKVLVRTQPVSDAIKGFTAKFSYLYEGPYSISKILGHSTYEIRDERGKVRGEFHLTQLKPYKEQTTEESENKGPERDQ